MIVQIIQYAIDPFKFHADALYKSMKGFGTDDRKLCRIITARCEVDMAQIKTAYERDHGHSLAKQIKGDCGGDYKRAFFALIAESA